MSMLFRKLRLEMMAPSSENNKHTLTIKAHVADDEVDMLEQVWNIWKKWSYSLGIFIGFDVRLHIFSIVGAVYMLYDLRDTLGISKFFLCYIAITLTMIFHEISHLLAAKLFKREVKGLILMPPFLAAAIIQVDHRKYLQNIIISASGPLVNILFGIIIVMIYEKVGSSFILFNSLYKYWGFEYQYFWLLYRSIGFLGYISVYIGFINLIPFYPMDGGHILNNLLLLMKAKNIPARMITFSIGVCCFVAIMSWALSHRDYVTIIISVLLLITSYYSLIEKKTKEHLSDMTEGAIGNE
jgi:Zn-dependent protease